MDTDDHPSLHVGGDDGYDYEPPVEDEYVPSALRVLYWGELESRTEHEDQIIAVYSHPGITNYYTFVTTPGPFYRDVMMDKHVVPIGEHGANPVAFLDYCVVLDVRDGNVEDAIEAGKAQHVVNHDFFEESLRGIPDDEKQELDFGKTNPLDIYYHGVTGEKSYTYDMHGHRVAIVNRPEKGGFISAVDMETVLLYDSPFDTPALNTDYSQTYGFDGRFVLHDYHDASPQDVTMHTNMVARMANYRISRLRMSFSDGDGGDDPFGEIDDALGEDTAREFFIYTASTDDHTERLPMRWWKYLFAAAYEFGDEAFTVGELVDVLRSGRLDTLFSDERNGFQKLGQKDIDIHSWYVDMLSRSRDFENGYIQVGNPSDLVPEEDTPCVLSEPFMDSFMYRSIRHVRGLTWGDDE